jgi:hypothetical protein
MPALRPELQRTVPVSGDADTAVRTRKAEHLPLSVGGPVLAFLLLLAGIGPTAASDASISIELNRLETVEQNCRLSFVLTNGLPTDVDALSIEAVLFDTDGVVHRFLLLKARPLPPGKTRVQQFDVGDTDCAGIGSILLNDITDCAGEGLSPAACLEAIRPTSKADIPFTASMPPGGG